MYVCVCMCVYIHTHTKPLIGNVYTCIYKFVYKRSLTMDLDDTAVMCAVNTMRTHTHTHT